MKTNLIIYTDGASRGNPGPGGWGAVIIAGTTVMEIAGAARTATNNQMELAGVEAVLSDSGALSWKGDVIVHSDSAYVINGATKWVYGWEKNGWITSTKTPVENKGQWQNLMSFARQYGTRLKFQKVQGHAGELYNERCDELAVGAALGKKIVHYNGPLKNYEAFLAEQGTTIKTTAPKKKSSKSSAPAYSYVSLVSGKVYADKTWAACEKRVKGTKGAKYKKVFSKAEETGLIQDYTLHTLL